MSEHKLKITVEDCKRMSLRAYKCKCCKGEDFFIPSHCFTGITSRRVDGIYCMDCGEYVEWENNMWIERAD